MNGAVVLMALLAATPPPVFETALEGELWETAVRCDAKYESEHARAEGLELKLAARTSTVIEKLVVAPQLPQVTPSAPSGALSTEVVVVAIVAAALGGVVVGWALAGRGSEGPIVVR